jgi:hypothetical protein
MMLHHPHRTRLFMPMILSFAMIAIGCMLLLLLPALAAAQPAPANLSAETDCTTASTVPAAECRALVELFNQTDGANWHKQSGWLTFASGNAPCDWYGVSCQNDQVTALILSGNGLSGTLPLSLAELSGLTRLRLDRNALRGRVPPSLCQLANTLGEIDLDYNALFTRRSDVARCLQPQAGDWQTTQTTAVTELQLTKIHTDALRLTWTPISYTADGGYYEVAVATDIDGPYTVHGHTADKHESTYLVSGLEPGHTYYLLVRSFTPPHGDQPSAAWSNPARMVGVTRALAGRVLVAAYFPADNDLSSEIGFVIERFRLGTALNPNVQVVLLVDGRRDGDTSLLEIAGGEVTVTTAVEKHWGTAELDTADPAVLAWFLRHARTTFPSERTLVTLLGHGIPLTPEVSWAPPAPVAAAQNRPGRQIPPLPKEHEYTPSDLTNNSYMSTIGVGQALLNATDDGANPFDIVFFDQCFQGSLDVLYEVHRTASVFVASPNYAWLAAAYHKYLTQLTPTSTPEEIGQAIIDLYQGSLDNRHPNTIFWVRSATVVTIAEAVSDLGDALRAATQAGQTQKIANAVRQSQYVDTTQCGRQNFQLGPPDELIGIESFGAHLLQEFGAADPYGVANALDSLYTAMQTIQKRTRSGHPYIAPDEVWNYGNTLTILAPLPRNSPADVAWRASVYRADAPFTATWTIDPSQTITVTASLAYAKEGRWGQFLAEWYNDLPPTVGQWCHYIPPEQVLVEEAETLTLSATLNGADRVELNWTPTEDASATTYLLYHQGPYDIGWSGRKVLPIEESALLLEGLEAGTHRFALLARNADQQFVAQSNEVIFEIQLEFGGEKVVLLPLVIR